MSLDALPIELEEKVLSNLSPVELARVSTTNTAFLAAHQQGMAEEQKALGARANEWFGRKRTKRFAEFLQGFFKEDMLDDDLAEEIGLFITWSLCMTGMRLNLDTLSGEPVQMRMHIVEGGFTISCPIKGRADPGWVILLQALLSGVVPSAFRDGQSIRMCIRIGSDAPSTID
jgi:hypothetical protein